MNIYINLLKAAVKISKMRNHNLFKHIDGTKKSAFNSDYKTNFECSICRSALIDFHGLVHHKHHDAAAKDIQSHVLAKTGFSALNIKSYERHSIIEKSNNVVGPASNIKVRSIIMFKCGHKYH